jgi:hypothetical protein
MLGFTLGFTLGFHKLRKLSLEEKRSCYIFSVGEKRMSSCAC